jgi:DNA-binding transcriptional regulator YiaG
MTSTALITSDELRAMLKAAGMSQTKLAACLEVNDRTVRRWASGDIELRGMAAIAVRAVLAEPTSQAKSPAPSAHPAGPQ